MGYINVSGSGLGPAVQTTNSIGGYYTVAPIQNGTGIAGPKPAYGPVTVGNGQEFGRVFDVGPEMMVTPDFEMSMITIVMKDYQNAKSETFPGWKGFPEIKVNQTLQGLQIGWYALVPNSEIFNAAEEEHLWNE